MPRIYEGSGTQHGQAVKWPTPEARKAACDSFCEHIRSGYSKDSWPEADDETVKRYMRDFPEDFDQEKIKRAERESRLFWEKIGVSGTIGKLKGFNAKSWEFNMQNRLGWSNKTENKNTNESAPITVYIEKEEKLVLEDHIKDIVENE